MEAYERVLSDFINKYATMPGIKGIFWGGSSCGHAPEAFSDMDLFVVTNDDVQRRQGLCQINGIDIEFFVNPINRICRQMEAEIKEAHDYWAIKIYAFSKIIYDPQKEAEQLQKKALEMFALPFIDVDYNKDLQNYYQAYDAYQKCNGMFQRHLQWRIMYYECMKALLNAHCYHNKLPLIPWSKAQRLLSDEKYRISYHLKALPELEFCVLFMCCFEDCEEKIMLERLKNLFRYCISKSDFDPENYIITK